jgi:hypothetical protein
MLAAHDGMLMHGSGGSCEGVKEAKATRRL